ncbi:MAG: ATP-binding protein [Clostridia bacterium]
MKVEEIKINAFGTLKNKEINLSDKINIIHGKNESGKSTLLTYIKTAFYGISRNKNGKEISDYDKYKPWSGEEFSGKIKYTLDNGEQFEIFRDFNKKNPKIYNAKLEDVTNQFNIDKKEGSQFFFEQVGIDENIFTSTIMAEQQEVKLSEQRQNILIQKIANIAGTGNSNMSYNKAKDRLNKKQLDEVGTERTQGKPINILKNKIKNIEQILGKLNLYKENKSIIEQNKIKLKNKIQEQEQRKELIKQISELNGKIIIETEKANYKRNIKEEKESRIQELINEKNKLIQENKNNKTNNKLFIIIFLVLISLLIANIVIIKNKFITYTTLILVGAEIVIYYLAKAQKEKRKKEVIKNNTDLINTKIELLEKEKEVIEEEIKTEENELKAEKEHIKNKYNIELYDIENSKNDLEQITNEINEGKIKLNTLEIEEKGISSQLEELITLQEEHENLSEQLKEIEQKNYEINLAKEFLEKAYEKMKTNITPKFTENLSQTIKNITNDKYSKVNINDENGLIIEMQNGEYVSAEKLSIGTIDQLYLSLRMSMVEEISKEKMPIILDEAFAYYDDERLENILKYLIERFNNHQLIIFTCTNREKEILNKLNYKFNNIEL